MMDIDLLRIQFIVWFKCHGETNVSNLAQVNQGFAV